MTPTANLRKTLDRLGYFHSTRVLLYYYDGVLT